MLKFTQKLSDIVQTRLLKSRPPVARWNLNRGNIFYTCLYREKIRNLKVMSQGDPGERCGPWASCLFFFVFIEGVLCM
jgi:hypothetical protein